MVSLSSTRNARNTLKVMCGACDRPSDMHPIVDMPGDFVVTCDRLPEDIGKARWANHRGQEFEDFLLIMDEQGNGHEVLRLDTEGPESLTLGFQSRQGTMSGGSYVDEIDYVSPTVEWNALARWHDRAKFTRDGQEHFICTPTLEQHRSERMGGADEVIINAKGVAPYSSPDANDRGQDTQRNAYVEGFDGFLSLKLIDEDLTRKYHAHLYNVFTNKSGKVQVGSIQLTHNVDGTVTAECVNRRLCAINGKTARMTIRVNEATRDEQEAFVWAILSHGNNHAAKWFREREGFYPLHKQGCDLKCGLALKPEHFTVCTYSGPRPSLLTDDEQYAFLKEHERTCKDVRCTCGEVTWSLRPDRELALLAR